MLAYIVQYVCDMVTTHGHRRTHTLFFSSSERWVESLLQPVCCPPDWPYAFGRRPVLCHQQTHCNCTLAINTGWASESAGWAVIFTEMGKGSETIEVVARIFQCPPAFLNFPFGTFASEHADTPFLPCAATTHPRPIPNQEYTSVSKDPLTEQHCFSTLQ